MKSTKSHSWIRSLLGLDPLPAPAWAMSVSSTHLALARVERRDGAPRVEDLRIEQLAADTFQTGPLGGPARPTSDFGERCARLLGNHPPTEISLMVPDEWARLVFTETGDLPRHPQARNDVLAWKLKRLVPFRVDELRFEGVETPSIAGQEEKQRVLLTFAVEALLSQLERSLKDCGVRVGRIRNRTLGLLSATQALDAQEVALVVGVGTSSWSLLATSHGEPVLARSRPLPTGEDSIENLIRELRLSRAWLAEALPRRRLERVTLVCDRDERAGWTSVLESVFDVGVVTLEVTLAPGLPQLPLGELVPLCGTALEVIP